MIQAARSGKQNIVEGSMASGVSTETEMKLIGVARASFEELLEDYRDYLRTHNLCLWAKDDPRILTLRRLSCQKDKTYKTYKTYESYFDVTNSELFCNAVISLIHQTNFLLDKQLKSLADTFAVTGGIRERMYRARIELRTQKKEIALQLLREVYCELIARSDISLARKVEQAALNIKNRN